ncbi:MAG TPA: pyridoxamine 5'-phosphate oxidase [Candidatus Acidoferrum sp.]|nr:pyridoxamine 5'-phosphate oxidase [Candidatus Acidoferrum sp.]
MAIADLRKEYTLGALERADLDADPIAQFQLWFQHAQDARTRGSWLRRTGIEFYKFIKTLGGARPIDPNAMALATVDAQGFPSLRTVLLKGVDQRGFIFFTNYESRKGRELATNPRAALAFYWRELERQVSVAGMVEKISVAESEMYFKSRPRGSRIGAWASQQSAPIPDRAFLEKRWAEIEAKFPTDVPIPPFWGGYALKPERIEFWQGGASRLHDRFEYAKQADGSWKIQRLAP